MDVKKYTFTHDERDVCLLESLPQLYHPIEDFQASCNVSGEEVEKLYSGVRDILNSAFVQTGDEFTLSKWERYLRIASNREDTLENRRFRILAKLNDLPPYTDTYLVDKLTELCGEDKFRIFRNYTNYELIVEISLASEANTDIVGDIVRSIVPANLDVTIRSYRSRHYELEPFTHESLANYTHDQIKYRNLGETSEVN